MVHAGGVSDSFSDNRVYDLFYVYYTALISLFPGCFINILKKENIDWRYSFFLMPFLLFWGQETLGLGKVCKWKDRSMF